MTRFRYLATGLVILAAWCTTSLGDELAQPWGTVNGDNAGTAASDHSSLLWEFAGVEKAWEFNPKAHDLDGPGGRGAITFDELGNVYWKTNWDSQGITVASVTPHGDLRWEANTNGLKFRLGTFSTAAPVIGDGGTNGFAYAIGDRDGNGIAVAMSKKTGQIQWLQSLTGANWVGSYSRLTPVLYGGYLYVVGAPSGGTLQVYVIESSTGSMSQFAVTGLPASMPKPGTAMTMVPNAFGAGLHGLYFNLEGGSNTAMSVFALKVNPSSAALGWMAPGGMVNSERSHLIYSAANDLLYAHTWHDYGHEFYSYDPATGLVASNDNQLDCGHGYYDVGSLDFNGTDVIAGGCDGNIIRYIDTNGDGVTENGFYPTLPWYGELRTFGGLYQDAEGHSILLSGTNAGGASGNARVIAVDITNSVLNDCLTMEDDALYVDDLVVTYTSGSTTTRVDVGGFSNYAAGDLAGQNNGSVGVVGSFIWADDTSGGASAVGTPQVLATDPTGSGQGKVVEFDATGGCGGWQGAWFPYTLNPSPTGIVEVTWKQYRGSLTENVWVADNINYGNWWGIQWDQTGEAYIGAPWSDPPSPGVPVTADVWQTVTYTFDFDIAEMSVTVDGNTSSNGLFDPFTDLAGWDFEVEGTAYGNDDSSPADVIFSYDTGVTTLDVFTVYGGPVLGPKAPDGTQNIYYFEWPEPHKLIALQANEPPLLTDSWVSTAEHGLPNYEVDIPMDAQINLGGGDAIYAVNNVPPNFISFEPADPPDEPDGWTRLHIELGGTWYYGPYIDFLLAGEGFIDINVPNRKLDFTARYYQDPVTNTNPYGDAPIFVRFYHYEGTTLYGYRDYGIVYATQAPLNDPHYPAWTNVVLDMATAAHTDTNAGGNIFNPARVTRMRFYGSDWAGTGDDFIDVKNFQIIDYPPSYGVTLPQTMPVVPPLPVEPRDVPVTTLQVTLDQRISEPPAGAVTITGLANPGPYTPTLSIDATGKVLTMVVDPPLPGPDLYVATVSTAITDIDGLALAGDRDVEFHVMVGDIDADLDVDLADWAAFQQCFGPFAAGCFRSDLTPDKVFDTADQSVFDAALDAGTGPQ